MKIISACLCGVNCAWNGQAKTSAKAVELVKNGEAIPVCPEQLGGLSTPRLPQEIQGGSGEDVLAGRCEITGKDGKDATAAQFIRGAEETMKIARLVGATEFIAKSKSPSCGCGSTYDGTFSGTLVEGDGVTTAFLKRNGIKVTSENELI